MLLKSIKLENFRQFVDEQIDFSTDPDQNVTLIIGENGTGKTTFAQAFFWCLYGETSFTDKVLLNRTVSERMTPYQKAVVKVTLRLIHGSADYEIIRTQEYKKSYSNKVTGANTVLNISVKSADGNTHYLKPLECETEIKKILPKDIPELKKYCKEERAIATWVSDTLRVVSGNTIFYEHNGFDRYYEHEDFIAVNRGKIVSVNRSENKVLIKGMVNNG